MPEVIGSGFQNREQDKAWYADRNPKPMNQKRQHRCFLQYIMPKKATDAASIRREDRYWHWNGDIISQLKMQNEMKLTDETGSTISKERGMKNIRSIWKTDGYAESCMPYLQSFCSLEEKGVKERREQQVVDKIEQSRATVESWCRKIQQLRMQGKLKERQ